MRFTPLRIPRALMSHLLPTLLPVERTAIRPDWPFDTVRLRETTAIPA